MSESRPPGTPADGEALFTYSGGNTYDRAPRFPLRPRPSVSCTDKPHEGWKEGKSMNAQRARRLFAISAVGVLMGGGAAVGAAGTASAAAPSDLPTNHSRDWCDRDRHHDWWGHDCDFRDDFDDGSVVVIVVG